MAPKTSSSAAASAQVDAVDAADRMGDWMAAASAQGVKPEQALAFIGLGLMQKMAASGQDLPWIWNELEDGGSADLAGLRQRLELVQLALETGAPLTTAEVTALLGARPGAPVVERGGLRARRLSRNVWKLSRAEGQSGGFGDGFRRRL
jgi:hypothetical protein